MSVLYTEVIGRKELVQKYTSRYRPEETQESGTRLYNEAGKVCSYNICSILNDSYFILQQEKNEIPSKIWQEKNQPPLVETLEQTLVFRVFPIKTC